MLLGQELDEGAQTQCGLPTIQGGLGLYQAEIMSTAAFIAARIDVGPFVGSLFGDFEKMFPSEGILQQTYDE